MLFMEPHQKSLQGVRSFHSWREVNMESKLAALCGLQHSRADLFGFSGSRKKGMAQMLEVVWVAENPGIENLLSSIICLLTQQGKQRILK